MYVFPAMESLTRDSLDEPQFPRTEAAAIAGCTDGQLRGMLDRRLIELSNHNPGSGVVRLFTVRDVMKIAAAAALANVGVPMRLLMVAGQMVAKRTSELLDVEQLTNLSARQKWVLFPEDGPTGLWRILVVDDDHPIKFEMMPPSFCLLQIDEIIKRTSARLRAKLTGEEMPSHRGAVLDALGVELPGKGL